MNVIQQQEEIKKEFQLERVILFSDAVFAIIITIMVIEIRLPEELSHANDIEIKHEFFRILIKLLAYGASFFIVANFWMRHVKIFSFLRDYNKGLLIHNLLFLFSASLFPFAVGMITGSFKMHSLAFIWGVNIYIGIILSTLLCQTLLVRYLVANKEMLCINNSKMEDVLEWKAQRINLALVPLIGIVVIILNYFQLKPIFSLYTVALIGIVNVFLKRKYYSTTVKKIRVIETE